jgi:hypothetical protein
MEYGYIQRMEYTADGIWEDKLQRMEYGRMNTTDGIWDGKYSGWNMGGHQEGRREKFQAGQSARKTQQEKSSP